MMMLLLILCLKNIIRLSNLYDIDWKITNAFKDKNIKNITIRDYNKYRNNNK